MLSKYHVVNRGGRALTQEPLEYTEAVRWARKFRIYWNTSVAVVDAITAEPVLALAVKEERHETKLERLGAFLTLVAWGLALAGFLATANVGLLIIVLLLILPIYLGYREKKEVL